MNFKKEKRYIEMSPVEKYFKYKHLSPDERFELHRQETRKFAREQIELRKEQE